LSDCCVPFLVLMVKQSAVPWVLLAPCLVQKYSVDELLPFFGFTFLSLRDLEDFFSLLSYALGFPSFEVSDLSIALASAMRRFLPKADGM
jgi:hypothetical protein